jgi:hypothetical protein
MSRGIATPIERAKRASLSDGGSEAWESTTLAAASKRKREARSADRLVFDEARAPPTGERSERG